ncbi:MAG: hypothetical protein SGARI_007821, partial [Bacillariaceae sp.]
MIDVLPLPTAVGQVAVARKDESAATSSHSDTEEDISTDSEMSTEMAQLDDPTTWHSPIFFCGAPSIDREIAENTSHSLPLNEVVPFETDLFRGKILFRVKDVPPKDEEQRRLHQDYFENRKRFYQVVVQGQFLRDDITFRDLYIGARYDKPFDGIPGRKSGIVKKIQAFVQRMTPGMLFDIAADKPRVMAPMGTCQHLSVDKPGDEPSVAENKRGIEENTKLMFQGDDIDAEPFASSAERRKRLADPNCSCKFKVDPSLVYT